MSIFGSSFSGLAIKPRVFVSYHHDNDQYWYNEFNRVFSGTYDVVTDRSLDRAIDSDDPEYVERRIRENHITGTSCTIVLSGVETYKRKYVDWEIYATLFKEHGLLGIVLPGSTDGLFPYRFDDNYATSYAHWIHWTTDPGVLRAGIEEARNRSCYTSRINNSRQKMRRNG